MMPGLLFALPLGFVPRSWAWRAQKYENNIKRKIINKLK
jgi:hypothetical protein